MPKAHHCPVCNSTDVDYSKIVFDSEKNDGIVAYGLCWECDTRFMEMHKTELKASIPYRPQPYAGPAGAPVTFKPEIGSKNMLIIRGAPASGKTTWLKEHGLLAYTISPDDIRQEIYNGELGDSQVVWKFVQERVMSLLFEDEFFVLDAQDSSYKMWINLATHYDYKVWFKVMDTSRSECFKRNAAREGTAKLPDIVMMQAFEWLEENPIPDDANILPDDVDPIEFFNLEKEPTWSF